MVHRKLESTILEMLEVFRIVAINGPRQSGKTTLQKRIAKNKNQKSTLMIQVKSLCVLEKETMG